MAAWPFWDTLIKDKATACLNSQVEKQQSVAKALLDKDKGIEQSIGLLIAQHSKAKSDDPCGLAKFHFEAAVSEDKTLEEFENEANTKCGDIEREFEVFTDALDKHQKAVIEEDHQAKAQLVLSEMGGNLKSVSDSNARLARVACRKTGQDRDTVLAEVLGEHTLSEEARDDVFAAEWGKRIAAREDAARTAVKAMIASNEHRNAIDSCLEQRFEQATAEALQKKEHVQSRMLSLKKSISTGEAQLRDLADVKKQMYDELVQKREEFAKVLVRALELGEEAMDLEIHHSALGLQQEVTQGKLDLERTRLDTMAPAADLATDKLAFLHAKASECDASAQEKRKSTLEEFVPKVNPVLQAGALRKRAAIQLCRKMIEQKQTEIRSLEGELTAQRGVLQCSLTGAAGSPQHLRIREARLQASLRKLEEKLAQCKSMRDDMEQDLHALQQQYDGLKELEAFGATFDHDVCATKAAKLADEAHTEFQLFGSASEAIVSEGVDPQSNAKSLQLAVLPDAFKDLFQSAMKHEIEALVEARVRQVLAERAVLGEESDAGTAERYNVIDDLDPSASHG